MGWDWKSGLNAAANVAVIAASAAVLLAVWSSLSATRRPAPAAPPKPVALREGVKAPSITGVDYSRSERTLLLFLSVQCKYCQASAPFYRDLAATITALPGKAARRRVVAVFPENAAEVGEFDGREKLGVEAVSGYPLGDFGVSATPTAVLLSRDGHILHVWRGAPTKEDQDAIRAAVL